jgi:hypothetical protein
VAAVLDWAAGEGFGDMADEYGWDYRSAAEMRGRHLARDLAIILRS